MWKLDAVLGLLIVKALLGVNIMLEATIGGFSVFALAYVGFMHLMSRRADVLHGQFIEPTAAGSEPQPSLSNVVQRYFSGAWLAAKLKS